MLVRDFIEPMNVLSDVTTLGDIAHDLALGVPHFIRTESGLRTLTAAAGVGHALTRRVIDLPSEALPNVDAEDDVDVMLASSAEIMSVTDSTGVLGYVDRRTVLSAVADGVDPAALDVLLLTRMLPTLVHDLSNALSVAGLTLGRLEGTGIAGVEPAIRSLDHASMLLRRAHDLSSGRTEGPPPVVALETVLRGVEPTLRSVLGSGIELTLLVPDEPAQVVAYPRVIERSLLNLALNARDALGGRGDVRIGIELTTARYVTLVVEDNGPGVPPALAETLFEPGVTSNLGPKRGLGLASVRQSLHRVGATISVGYSPLGGASFRIRLRRPQPDD